MKLSQIEALAIIDAVNRCGGKKLEAAKELGIGKTTLYRRWRLMGDVSQSQPNRLRLVYESIGGLKRDAEVAANYLQECTGITAPKLGQRLQKAVVALEELNF